MTIEVSDPQGFPAGGDVELAAAQCDDVSLPPGSEAVAAGADHTMNSTAGLSTEDLCDIWSWNSTVPEASDVPVHTLIGKTIETHPYKTAICAWDGDWTYGELDARSTQLARHLTTLGLARKVLPLCFEKSKWMPVAQLAVMKAGAASVLLDPAQPEERLGAVAEQVSSSVMLCSPGNVELAGRLHMDSLVVGDGSHPSVSDGALPTVSPSDPLYLIFTSGTTGKPKGLAITHRNFSSAIRHQRDFMYTTTSRVFDFASYAFDVAWSNLLFALAGGACLCIPSENDRKNDLAQCIRRLRITHLDLTPATLRLLSDDIIRSVQAVNVGGEQLTARDAQHWRTMAALRNMFGPSECTPTTTMVKIEARTPSGSIGKGVGVCTWIVDARGELSAVGSVGELLLEGPLVGPGYLSVESTAAAFVDDPDWLLRGGPNHSGRHGRLYKTGDLVRYDTDGSLIFVGRKDLRVKINGQLAELAEIEHAVRGALPAVTGVVADVVTPHDYSKALLLAFLEIDKEASPEDGVQRAIFGLDDQLAKRLPAYMVPSVYVPLTTFPVTVTGKTDRQSLRAMIEQRTYHQLRALSYAQVDQQACVSPSERQLQGLWSSVLQIDADSISTNDSFLRMGGDSIGAMHLVAQAREHGLNFSVSDVMRHPRLRDLAKLASSSQQVTPDRPAQPFSQLRDSPDTGRIRLQAATLCNVSMAQVQDVFPCTPLQEGLLALTALREGDYVARHVFELQDSVDFSRLREAWAQVVASTPILRTRIVSLLGQGLVQTVLDEQVPWSFDKGARAGAKQLQLEDGGGEMQQTVVLGGRLVQFELETEQDGRRFFTWTIHHSLFDGRSIPLILQALYRAYAGEPWEAAPVFQSFVKHVLSIDQMQATTFWARQLRDLEAPNFPSLPSPKYVPQACASVTRPILNLHWPQTDVTPSNIIRAAWALVVSHYTNPYDVVFGATSAGCQAPVLGIESMTGPTIATVPVRVRLDDLITVREFLQEVQAQAIEMTEFEQVGLQHIRRISADAERACQFQSLLVVQPKDRLPSVEGGVLFRRIVDDVADGESAMTASYTYAVTVTCQPNSGRLDLRIDFDPKVMEAVQISRIAAHMEYVLRQLCALEKADLRVFALDRMSEIDLRDVWSWNAVVPQACPTLIHERIAKSVQARPKSLAVDAWDGKWSYAELDTLSSRLASHLLSFGIDYRNRLIPLYFEKSKWTPIAMLAVMKAGGASVAIDPSQPVERLATIMEQIKPSVVLTSPAQLDVASRLAPGQLVVVGESHMAELGEIEIGQTDGRVPDIDPASIIYCVFTSGSTGTPKGVLVNHTNFSSAIQHQHKWYGYDASSRVYDFASYAFDAAWLNVLATFCGGGCLCIPQDTDRINDLAGSMNRLRATHVDLTPSVARLLPRDTLQQLHTLIVSGETLEPAEALRWARLVDLKNVYGPCECTPTATMATIPANAQYEGSLIGKGVGVCTWVVDGDSLVPIGGVGELLLEGPLVGMGYLGDADESAAAFIEDPPWLLRGAPGYQGRHGRLYKTGDLVRYNMDGSLTFIGRTDTRIKINGQLVELAEVEHHIRAYEQVRQCACLVPRSGLYAKRLVGAFSLHGIFPQDSEEPAMQALPDSAESSVNLHVDSIRHILDRALPPYMVPAILIGMRDIPLSTSGKIDRSELHRWLSSITVHPYRNRIVADHASSGSAKQSDVEGVLLDACSVMLDVPLERLDRQRSFVGNGGDSISAMRVVPRCRAANIIISVASLLQERSLTNLAQTLVVQYGTALSRVEDFDKPFPLSPIQRWFFAQLQADQVRKPECHYNMSFYLRLRRRVCPSKMSMAVIKVLELHSMLRARFCYNGGTWMQHVRSPSVSFHSLQVVQVQSVADVATLAKERQRQIDIQKGPVFFADLSEQPDRTQYLTLIAHHLVVDLVSWRIILDDLETALSGGLLHSCLPFQKWNELQIGKARAPSMKSPKELLSTQGACNELGFWEFLPSTPNMQSDHQTRVMEVDSATTGLLLGDANQALHTEPVDLLLSAIWAAFFPVFLERQGLTIWKEGHGREPWSTEIDLSRTVGWFTTLSPIHIGSSMGMSPRELTRAVKDARKRLPANGWAYFASRYLSQRENDLREAHELPVEVEFNYHGKFQQLEREDSLFDPVALDEVADEGPQIPAPHLFGIEVSIQDQRATLAVSWNRHIAHQDRIQNWIDGIPASLKALCRKLASTKPSKTLCDYPFLDLDYARLDELQECLLPHIEAVNNSKIVEVLPCSPTATGMLLSQSKQPQLYKTGEIFELAGADGRLPSATSLAAAWQQVIAHQPSLRSVFTPGLDHKAAFNQVVLDSCFGEVAHFDSDNEAAAMEHFTALQPLDCQQLKPPHRLSICRVGQHGRRIICQLEMSHALTDAMSSDLLIHNWSCAYEGTLPNLDLLEPCREVARTFTTRAEDMLGYWRQKLEGLLPCYFPRLSPGMLGNEASEEVYGVTLELPSSLVQALERLTHTLSVTSVGVLQAAWALTLASYCGTESVCFGYIASGRDLPIEGLDKCVGAYANLMVCRVNDAQKTPYRHLIQTIHRQMVQDLGFQHCHLAAIQHALKISPGQSLFNTSLNCQRVGSNSRISDSEQRFSFQTIDGKDPTEFDVAARVAFGDGYAELGLETRLPFMSQEQARRVLSLYLSTIAAFADITS